jgi:vitamin B12 transporter
MKLHSCRPAALCGLALLALSPIARAAELAVQQPALVAQADMPAPAVVVTATRIAQPVTETLGDVRVIGPEQVRAAAGMSLIELLQAQAGVEIITNGGPGQSSNVFVRGTNANHVVVLVDGVRVNSATAGTTAFEHLPLALIERVEVLRGPASSLYGSDAIGGVIQIFTRQGDFSHARIGLGTDNTQEVSAGLGRRFGGTALSLDLGYRKSDGFSATSKAKAANTDDDGFRNVHIGAHVSQEWARGQTLELRGFASRSNTHFDDVQFLPPDYTLTNEKDGVARQRVSALTLESRNQINDAWHSTLRLSRSADRSRNTGFEVSRFDTTQDQLTWQNDVKLPVGRLAAGVEWRRERVDSSVAFTQNSRVVRSAFGSYTVTLGAHQVEASLRHDENSQFGNQDTGRLAYGYRFAPAWRVSAAAGTAFKAPTLNDLYWPEDFANFFVGNPALRPEHSRSVEGALRYDDGAHRAGLTLFRNRVRDLIGYDSQTTAPFLTTTVNVNRALIRGATLDAAHVTPLWNVRAEWTWQEPEDAVTGHELARRARNFGSASANWTPGPWQAGVELVAAGQRFNSLSNADSTRMGGYALVNLRAGYALTPELTLSARLNNAADRQYELVQGYNTPGRQFFVALEYAGK